MTPPKPPANGRQDSAENKAAAKAPARNTDSGPARMAGDADHDALAQKMAQTQALAAGMPFNPTKAT